MVFYVDGSYDKDTGCFSYGVVVLADDGGIACTLSRAFGNDGMSSMRNVAGEIMGATAAIEYAVAHGAEEIVVCHDYQGISSWPDGTWRAKNAYTQDYKKYVQGVRETTPVRFVKVSAHTGVEYNELADRLAKDALKDMPGD